MPFLYLHFPLRIRTFSATFPKVCGQPAYLDSLDRTDCCQRPGVRNRMVGRRAFTLRALTISRKQLSVSIFLWLEGRIVLYAVGPVEKMYVGVT